MATLNKYNNQVMSETINPNTGKSDAQVYNESMDVVAKATAMLNKSKQNTGTATGTTTDTGTKTGFKYDYSGNLITDKNIQNLRDEAEGVMRQKVDDDKIKRDTLKLFQKEIDATNNIYNDIVNRQEIVNADNEGGLRAIQNRQGLVGSMRGFSQTQGQRDLGQQAIGTINAERATKISAIQGLARKEALDEITARRKAKQEGASSYLSLIEMEDERKAKRVSNVLSAMVSQGIDPNEMLPAELNEIAKNLGVGVQDVISGYSDATAESRAKEEASTRENSIVNLIKQGVTDPKDLLDYLNYNEAGDKIGDVTLAEIKAVQDALKVDDKAFNLSEGQSRYVLQPDGTYKEIASKGKTYAPSKDGSRGSTSPYYFEFGNDDAGRLIDVNIPEAQIAQIEKDLNQYGYDAVAEGLDNDAQRKVLRDLVQNKTALQSEGDKGTGEKFIDRNYIKSLFTDAQLKKLSIDAGFGTPEDDGAGFWNMADPAEYDTESYLNYLDGLVANYRKAGYTDEEIMGSLVGLVQ